MDKLNHKEFRFSNDGAHVAVGSVDNDVCVIHTATRKVTPVSDVSYQFGGKRLAVSSQEQVLFAGAYHNTGVGAYSIETGERIWYRRDLKKLQSIAFDSLKDFVYCEFEDRASRPLKAMNGREKKPIRGLKGFYFSPDARVAVFEFDEAVIENRATDASHRIPPEARSMLGVAFARSTAVVSWVGGPVIAYDVESGAIVWRYATEGTHAFSVATATDGSSVWVAEQPYNEPPWHRLRRLDESGNVMREVRCALTHSFAIVPYRDEVIRADTEIVNIESLESI